MKLDGNTHDPRDTSSAYTLVELLIVLTIVMTLTALGATAYQAVVERAKIAKSTANLRQLVTANLAYAADHKGQLCPAQDKRNVKRWHGERSRGSGFDPSKGFLAPYLGGDGRVKQCPLFLDFLDGSDGSWEDGTGGYGYNSTYVGGSYARTGKYYLPEYLDNISHPSRTVMFTTTAFARNSGLQEYPYTEPPFSVRKGGALSGALQPSTHFRAAGRAIVAWCDGHVSLEKPSGRRGPNYYGAEDDAELIGWFGPREHNGFWNPRAPAEVFRR